MSMVSVIIPTYNRAHLLGRAIKSGLDQTFQDFELIVVDDSSIDETEQLIKSFQDKRIIYVRHEINLGSNPARNTGLRHANGEYIAFLDSDDEWLPEKLKKQLEIFRKGPEKLGLVSTGYIYEQIPNEPFLPQYRGNVLKQIIIANIVGSTSTPLIKKVCFKKAGIFDETMPASQDWDMWIRIAQYYDFDFVPEVLVRYHWQTDSISKNIKRLKKAHRLIFKKYKYIIKAFPKKVLLERYLYEGRYFFWRRDFLESFRYFTKAVFLNPLAFFRIIHYYGRKLVLKILN